MNGKQLPLSVQLRDTASFETYHAGPNAEAVAAVQKLLSGGPALLLYGPRGSGKTHLLQALARTAHARRLRCVYLPLAEFGANGSSVLQGLEEADVVCLDDLDAVLTQPDWVLDLLRLLDALRTHGARHVLAAGSPPERLAIDRPDLATRLSACTVYGLKPLDDADRSALLRTRARARGLELPEDVARYLLNRLARDTGSLLSALDELDRASLAAQRRLTVPFVQQVLRDAPPRADGRTADS